MKTPIQSILAIAEWRKLDIQQTYDLINVCKLADSEESRYLDNMRNKKD